MDAVRAEKILYTLWLLSNRDYSKKELIEEYLKANMGEVSRYSITSYINTLIEQGFPVLSKKENGKNVYHLKKEAFKLRFTDEEIEHIENIKKIIISQKNIRRIRKLTSIIYKLVLEMENDDHKNILLDFGYYSKINWHLVQQLEYHCASKDIIILDYVKPDKTPVKLQMHTDRISVNEWSDKIYLWGTLYNSNEFSFLPVDRIFMVDEVIEKNVPFENLNNKIEYKISRKLYNEIELDKEEEVVSLTKDFALIKREKNNKFYILQRLMSFCPELYYISDDEIKKELEEKLKSLRELYEK